MFFIILSWSELQLDDREQQLFRRVNLMLYILLSVYNTPTQCLIRHADFSQNGLP